MEFRWFGKSLPGSALTGLSRVLISSGKYAQAEVPLKRAIELTEKTGATALLRQTLAHDWKAWRASDTVFRIVNSFLYFCSFALFVAAMAIASTRFRCSPES